VKCNIPYKKDGLLFVLVIREDDFNRRFRLSFDNMRKGEGKLEKAMECNNRKAYATNDKTSRLFSTPVTQVVKYKEENVFFF
jgi:hypothetical protein